jgi:hypothetical protein
LESGIIGLGFIPLKIQGFYSTEKQKSVSGKIICVSVLILISYMKYQKSKSLEAIENENRKLISLKRDYGRQKSTFRSKVKFNDSFSLRVTGPN